MIMEADKSKICRVDNQEELMLWFKSEDHLLAERPLAQQK